MLSRPGLERTSLRGNKKKKKRREKKNSSPAENKKDNEQSTRGGRIYIREPGGNRIRTGNLKLNFNLTQSHREEAEATKDKDIIIEITEGQEYHH